MAVKLTATPVDPAVIERASKTAEAAQMVELAGFFQRAGAHGPFTVEIPLHCPVLVEGKEGYRRMPIPAGTKINPLMIYLGKKQGLIFRFSLVGEFKRDGKTVQALEIGWHDITGSVPEFEARLGTYYGEDATKHVWSIDEAVRHAIDKNPSMHGILSEGFKKAQEAARENANSAGLEDNPIFGQF